MFIDVVRPETWDELNDQVKSSLGLDARLRVRCYQGLAHAVFEIAQGTAQFMSHKKAMGVVLGTTAVFENLLPYYYKETYEVAALSHSQLTNVKEWVEGLKKDTCFVLFSEDHPVTGELYPYVEELDKLLNERRIFSFRVSHAQHRYHTAEVRPYTVRLCSVTASAAVAILGERFRSPALLAMDMNWDKTLFLQRIEKARGHRDTNAALVEKFEKDVAAVATRFFPVGAARLGDRAVIVLNEVSAEAVAENLFKKMGLSPHEGWQRLSSTNMCHWSGIKMFRHWWQPTPSQEQLRGLLVIGLELLNTKDFAKLLISSYEEIKEQQSWSV
ncbi:MAG: hypothetical protein HUU57_11175 [Bdellovibrio sp.]|nr:hypothetical protein [Bdellovibrio sp.]